MLIFKFLLKLFISLKFLVKLNTHRVLKFVYRCFLGTLVDVESIVVIHYILYFYENNIFLPSLIYTKYEFFCFLGTLVDVESIVVIQLSISNAFFKLEKYKKLSFIDCEVSMMWIFPSAQSRKIKHP